MNLDITRDELRCLPEKDINTLLLRARDYWLTPDACCKIIMMCDNIISIYGDGRLPMVHSTKLEAAMRGKVLISLLSKQGDTL